MKEVALEPGWEGCVGSKPHRGEKAGAFSVCKAMEAGSNPAKSASLTLPVCFLKPRASQTSVTRGNPLHACHIHVGPGLLVMSQFSLNQLTDFYFIKFMLRRIFLSS